MTKVIQGRSDAKGGSRRREAPGRRNGSSTREKSFTMCEVCVPLLLAKTKPSPPDLPRFAVASELEILCRKPQDDDVAPAFRAL